jgi:hypothetical protein
MSPGGHLVTPAAACAVAAAHQQWSLAAGIAAGGFLIDVDHAVDYVLFDGHRDLRPGAFLRHYSEGRLRRAVLSIVLFYSFVYRAAHRFEAARLLGGGPPRLAPEGGFWAAFFGTAPASAAVLDSAMGHVGTRRRG